MSPLTLLVFDEDPSDLGRLRSALEAAGGVILEATGDLGRLLDLVRTVQVDLVVCAWNGGRGDAGERLAPLFAGGMPKVVVVADDASHALDAFQWGAADYLTKPCLPERCRAMLQRAELRCSRRSIKEEPGGAGVGEAREVDARHGLARRILARDGDALVPVQLNEILWAQAEAGGSLLHLLNGRILRLAEPLTRLEGRFPPAAFMRIRRDTLVALDAVREVRQGPGRNHTVTLTGRRRFEVTGSRRRELEQRLNCLA